MFSWAFVNVVLINIIPLKPNQKRIIPLKPIQKRRLSKSIIPL
jgi:hypothetical protein